MEAYIAGYKSTLGHEKLDEERSEEGERGRNTRTAGLGMT